MVVAGDGKSVGINEGPVDILRKRFGEFREVGVVEAGARDVGVVGTGANEDRRLSAAFALRSRTLRAANSIWMTISFIPLLAVL